MNVFDRAALLEGLQRLGLTHMQQVVEHRAEEAAAASSGYLEFLYQLVEEELAVRFERYVETARGWQTSLSGKPSISSTSPPSPAWTNAPSWIWPPWRSLSGRPM